MLALDDLHAALCVLEAELTSTLPTERVRTWIRGLAGQCHGLPEPLETGRWALLCALRGLQGAQEAGDNAARYGCHAAQGRCDQAEGYLLDAARELTARLRAMVEETR